MGYLLLVWDLHCSYTFRKRQLTTSHLDKASQRFPSIHVAVCVRECARTCACACTFFFLGGGVLDPSRRGTIKEMTRRGHKSNQGNDTGWQNVMLDSNWLVFPQLALPVSLIMGSRGHVIIHHQKHYSYLVWPPTLWLINRHLID